MDQHNRHKIQQQRRELAQEQWQRRIQQGISARPAKAEQVELSPKGQKKDEEKDQGRGI